MTRIEKIIVAVLAVLSLSFIGYIVSSWTSQTAPAARAQPSAETGKCDSADTIATLKSMALGKINGPGSDYLIAHRSWYLRRSVDAFALQNLTVDSFRRRGTIGDAGLSCAALVAVHSVTDKSEATISVEYSIEPTTDGKTVVSARFKPN